METRYMIYELITTDEAVEVRPRFSFATEEAAAAFRYLATSALVAQPGPGYVDVFYRPVRGFGDDAEAALEYWTKAV